MHASPATSELFSKHPANLVELRRSGRHRVSGPNKTRQQQENPNLSRLNKTKSQTKMMQYQEKLAKQPLIAETCDITKQRNNLQQRWPTSCTNMEMQQAVKT